MSTTAEPTVDAPASEWIEWLITPAVAEDDKRRLATRMVEEMRDLQAQVERLEGERDALKDANRAEASRILSLIRKYTTLSTERDTLKAKLEQASGLLRSRSMKVHDLLHHFSVNGGQEWKYCAAEPCLADKAFLEPKKRP